MVDAKSDTLTAMTHDPVARPRHIVVTGLMGAGKTSVGRRLATWLGLAWRDSDADIEAETGRTVRELRDSEGVEAMHAREAQELLGSLAGTESTVISAAASVIDDPACRAAMSAPDVLVIWLHARADVLADRFDSSDDHRPAYGESPQAFLAEQAALREPLLGAISAHVIDTDGLTVEEVVERARLLLR